MHIALKLLLIIINYTNGNFTGLIAVSERNYQAVVHGLKL